MDLEYTKASDQTQRKTAYRGRDLNPHGPCGPKDFKSFASTNSATPACHDYARDIRVLLLYYPKCTAPINDGRSVEATIGIEPMNRGFADLRLSHLATSPSSKRQTKPRRLVGFGAAGHFTRGSETEARTRLPSLPVPLPRDRAGNGIRTRDINLGKVALYQLSYSRRVRSPNIHIPTYRSKHFLQAEEGTK
jgi:hypothetical protein